MCTFSSILCWINYGALNMELWRNGNLISVIVGWRDPFKLERWLKFSYERTWERSSADCIRRFSRIANLAGKCTFPWRKFVLRPYWRKHNLEVWTILTLIISDFAGWSAHKRHQVGAELCADDWRWRKAHNVPVRESEGLGAVPGDELEAGSYLWVQFSITEATFSGIRAFRTEARATFQT